MRAGIGQALCGDSATASARRARLAMCGRASRSGHSCFISWIEVDLAAALDAEADVGPPVGERERPRVAGQQVGLEPHPELRARPPARRRRSTAGTRATRRGSPGRPRRAACAAATTCRRRRSRTRACTVPRPSTSSAIGRRRRAHAGERVALVHLHARATGEVDERARRARCGATTAAYTPRPVGSGNSTIRPDGERTHAASTVCHEGSRAGDRPSCSSSRSAPASSARRRSTCRGGTWPCRRARHVSPRRERDGRGGARRTGADDSDIDLEGGTGHAVRVEALRLLAAFARGSPWRAPGAWRAPRTRGVRR